jgi:GNAT superfamily N-acetyltransferase
LLIYDGEILEPEDDSDECAKIGEISVYLLQRDRIMEEGESAFEAMDSLSASTREAYDALFHEETGDWKEEVTAIYEPDFITQLNLLMIESIKLEPRFRRKGIGAQVVREIIATVGASCGIVACKPFPLQYSGWCDKDKAKLREQPGFEKERRVAFNKIAKYWSNLGFQKLPSSDFYVLSPEFHNVL